jgi:hypothetical protein
MSTFSESFVRLTSTFAKIDLFGSGPPEVPWGEGETPAAEDVTGPVEKAGSLLPLVYRREYVAQLLDQAPKLVAQLGARVDRTLLEALAGAVYDHDPERGVRAELHRFLAVVSDLFTSFLSRERRMRIDVPLTERLPPLAVFQSHGEHGPFTLAADSVSRLIGSNVGVVSLPSVYRRHPVLWSALAHETAGHDVSHADVDLLPELADQVQRLFGGPYPPSEEPTGEELQALVFSYWIDQTSADIYGLLNAGPAFVMNLASLFAAMNARLHPDQPFPLLRARAGASSAGLLDPHPPDLLRIPLAIGALENLRRLDPDVGQAYVDALLEIERTCAQGADEVEIDGAVPIEENTTIRIRTRVPLEEWRDAARRVGQLVAEAKLTALRGHAIQDIETWDDPDEATAQRIREALARDESVVRVGNDAQLLSGATLALLDDPDRYDIVTARLEEALDESFASDPIWGSLVLDRMYVP